MSRLAHISDLHFGAENAAVVQALGDDIRLRSPDLVIVSGDLTQRAKKSQFAAAARFLADLGATTLVVPGNHDVPLWNLAHRLFRPFRRWHGSLASPLNFAHAHDDLLVMGVNTVRSLRVAEGYFSSEQTRAVLGQIEAHDVTHRVVVTHHPLLDGKRSGRRVIKPRNLAALGENGVDLLISGHHHRTAVEIIQPHDRSLVACTAGTATSTRQRGEVNAYNWIEFRSKELRIATRSLVGGQFEETDATLLIKSEAGWSRSV